MEITDSNVPYFSVVMPAYNAEKFIAEAIESVMAQSFHDWELIIVDDGSNDNTSTIVNSYVVKDKRIRTYKMSMNSGSAFQPRKKAIEMAHSEWILYLDADDYIEKDYLSKFYSRLIARPVDLILGEMVFVNELGSSIGVTLPLPDVCTEIIYDGRELVRDTLNGWRIGFNSVLSRKDILLRTISFFDINSSSLADDELMSRYVLLESSSVAFVGAKYYYRGNPESITNKVSIKIFDILDSDITILHWTEKEFGRYSVEMVKAALMQFNDLSRCIITFYSNNFAKEDKIEIEGRIKRSYGFIKWSLLKGKVNILKFIAMRSGIKTFNRMYKIYGFTWKRK